MVTLTRGNLPASGNAHQGTLPDSGNAHQGIVSSLWDPAVFPREPVPLQMPPLDGPTGQAGHAPRIASQMTCTLWHVANRRSRTGWCIGGRVARRRGQLWDPPDSYVDITRAGEGNAEIRVFLYRFRTLALRT